MLTAYNAREAEDDLEVLWTAAAGEMTTTQQPEQEEDGGGLGLGLLGSSSSSASSDLALSAAAAGEASVLWGPALNPHRSLERRSCDTLKDEPMFENCCWLCVAAPHVALRCAAEAHLAMEKATASVIAERDGDPNGGGLSAERIRSLQEAGEVPPLLTVGAMDPRREERREDESSSDL